MDRESRTCFLGRERVRMTAPYDAFVTREEVLSIAREHHLLEDLVGSLQTPPRIRGEGGRLICPLPLPDRQAAEAVSLAVDASEHHLPLPQHNLMRQAVRIVRDALAERQRRQLKRMERKGK